MTFADLGLPPDLMRAVEDSGYGEPTPIQTQAIPAVLDGRDVLGIAQTGTGKTAAFTLPILTVLAEGRARARIPRSLILCPTRELAAQVAASFETYGKYNKLSMALLIGGVSFAEQNARIDRGVDVLIATPGRLLDHFERGRLMLTGVQICVIDEADRMLDMGFIPDVERIFRLLPFSRQTLLFSATMPSEIARLADEFIPSAVRVEVSPPATTVERVRQCVIRIRSPSRRRDKARYDALRNCFQGLEGEITNAIVFCNRKSTVRNLHEALRDSGVSAGALHGDIDQHQRMATLAAFRNSEIPVLVASDVAARGLDIPTVSHVFNFEVPLGAEAYVHRIGRTARAGRSGTAITICDDSERDDLAQIEARIGTSLEGLHSEPSTDDVGPHRSKKRSRQFTDGAAVDEVAGKGKIATENDDRIRPPKKRQKQKSVMHQDARAETGAPLTFGDMAPAFLLQKRAARPPKGKGGE